MPVIAKTGRYGLSRGVAAGTGCMGTTAGTGCAISPETGARAGGPPAVGRPHQTQNEWASSTCLPQ